MMETADAEREMVVGGRVGGWVGVMGRGVVGVDGGWLAVSGGWWVGVGCMVGLGVG